MNKSDEIKDLADALAKAQGEIENASKSSVNPHFKSKYADLAEVLNTVRPVFSVHGLSVTQMPSFADGVCSVETLLMHSSGQWISSTASATVSKNDAQGVGSCITYLRRYSLAAVAGIAQEDDDANAAVGNRPKTQQQQPQPQPQKVQPVKILPTDGAWDAMSADEQSFLTDISMEVVRLMTVVSADEAHKYLENQKLDGDEKVALWTRLDSKTRSALKRAHEAAKVAA